MNHPVLEAAAAMLGFRLECHGDLTLLDRPRRMLLISRAEKFPQPDATWVLNTVAVAKQLVEHREVLVAGNDRLAYELAQWTVRQCGGPTITVLDRSENALPPPATHALYVWPQTTPSDTEAPQIRDRIIAALSTHATAIHIRKSGVMAELAASLRARSIPIDECPQLDRVENAQAPQPSPAPPGAVLDESTLSAWTFLTHFTRDPEGPWPGETRDEYLRWLSAGPRAPHRHAFAALCRILKERRLRGCGRLIAGSAPMVCFTARHPRDVGAITHWRRGLQRWTFTNYALAIPRHALAAAGARAVRYVDRRELDAALPNDKKFLQLTHSGEHDWSREEEWRVAGDLDLANSNRNAIVACVARADEAAHLYRAYGLRSMILNTNF